MDWFITSSKGLGTNEARNEARNEATSSSKSADSAYWIRARAHVKHSSHAHFAMNPCTQRARSLQVWTCYQIPDSTNAGTSSFLRLTLSKLSHLSFVYVYHAFESYTVLFGIFVYFVNKARFTVPNVLLAQSISAACVSAWGRAGDHQLHWRKCLLEVHLDEFMSSETSVSDQLPHATVTVRNALTRLNASEIDCKNVHAWAASRVTTGHVKCTMDQRNTQATLFNGSKE